MNISPCQIEGVRALRSSTQSSLRFNISALFCLGPRAISVGTKTVFNLCSVAFPHNFIPIMWSLLSCVQLYGACQAGVKGTSLSFSPNPAFSIRLFSFPSSHVRGVDFYLLSSSAFCWLRKSGKCVPHSIHTLPALQKVMTCCTQ